MGIEPTLEAWEAPVLPLNYTREAITLTNRRRPGKGRAAHEMPCYTGASPTTAGRERMQTEIAEVLIDIEAQLRQLGLWDKIPPSSQALASTEPFCVDTLSLPQWLQFVFIPTIYQMLEAGDPLPERCGIAPMAEEYFKGSGLGADALIGSLVEIDDLLSKPEG